MSADPGRFRDLDGHDPYELLGVALSANEEDIRLGYRARIKRKHPDLPGGDEQATKLLHVAKNILLDPRIRSEYDAYRARRAETPDTSENERKQSLWDSDEVVTCPSRSRTTGSDRPGDAVDEDQSPSSLWDVGEVVDDVPRPQPGLNLLRPDPHRPSVVRPSRQLERVILLVSMFGLCVFPPLILGATAFAYHAVSVARSRGETPHPVLYIAIVVCTTSSIVLSIWYYQSLFGEVLRTIK